ncbi:MAG TPA: polysaccharide deacetylase family protein [Longimicrobiales bacterium]|nr:polysaccharide deacetylase family protein [Longimicrobiales bacterium]
MKGILTYHSIDDSGSVVSVDPQTFERHVRWLAGSEVPVLPVSEVVSAGCSTGIALTFDDGFQNFIDEAWPILRDHGMPATVYVVTDRVGQDNGWDAGDGRIPLLPLMGWEALGRAAEEGVEIGSHTRTHPKLSALGRVEAAEEIHGSRTLLERELGSKPSSFAYPYGAFRTDIAVEVEAAGYGNAVTTEMRLVGDETDSLFLLPRLDAFYFRSEGILERWGSDSFRRFVRFRAGARHVRSVLRRARMMP